MTEKNPKYINATSRIYDIYRTTYDSRSEFERDEHRLLHCKAYRRLKNKTQVFFATDNDHICTRIEHVTHVASIAETIAKNLNLNYELVNAIAIGHDLGHAPFGHHGEYILNDIVLKHKIKSRFWHEGNSLNFIDNIETLPDYHGKERNLNLTYAVRDGIVCHCGEVNDKVLVPRNEFIDLNDIQYASHVNAYTYEGCVVKISDTIAYLSRDIEDALIYNILSKTQLKELEHIVQKAFPNEYQNDISTNLLNYFFIRDLCSSSSPEEGLKFTDSTFELMSVIKAYNTEHICGHKRLQPFKKYARLVIETIFEKLDDYYCDNILDVIYSESKLYPVLTYYFETWLICYSNINLAEKSRRNQENQVIYDINSQQSYRKAIIDFISAMTDKFAIKIFNEIISFS
ncbi:HD domain-containing protein [bacterium]|nr:HD domain-containing protein [bacterium]